MSPSTTRRRVLDAAAELISRQGLDVSMEAIAEQAGVTRMTVYRQLGRREQVLVAVLLDQGAAVADELRAILDEPGRPFAEQVVDVMVSVVRTVRSSPVLTFFVQGVTPTQIDRLDRDNEFLGGVWSLLLPYFEAAAARGELRADAAATLDWTLRQILLQLVVQGSSTASVAGLRAELELFFVPSIVVPSPT
jgi:AcrR family transcriptional regulator